jgi:hypothetical protein
MSPRELEEITMLARSNGRIYPESAFRNALKDMIRKQRSLKRKISIICILDGKNA